MFPLLETAELPKQHQELPRVEVQKKAFSFIQDFTQAFLDTPEFLDALGKHYFGDVDDHTVKSNAKRDISFWQNGVCWNIIYDFTDEARELSVMIESPDRKSEFAMIYLSLRSNRTQHQELPIVDPLVQVIAYHESMANPPVYRNTDVAAAYAEKMLEVYRSNLPN